MMINRRSALAMLAAVSVGARAQAAEWKPRGPIQLIVPFAPGGVSDTIARKIVGALGSELGTAIAVVNRGGAGGNIGMVAAARSAADGHTILLGNVSTNAINRWTFAERLPIDPLRDLVAVAAVATVPSLLVASENFPASTVMDMVEYVRRNPGSINYGSAGVGSFGLLDMLVLKRVAGLQMTHIPFAGGAGPMVMALLRGDVQLAFLNASTGGEHVRTGRLKGLGVSSQTRLPDLPNVPTMAEAGFPGVGSDSWQGLFVPAGTPVNAVAQLNMAVARVLSKPAIRDRLTAARIFPMIKPSSEHFAKFVAAETARWGQIVNENRAALATN